MLIPAMKTLIRILCLLLAVGAIWHDISYAREVTIFTLRAPENEKDKRKEYDNALLKLALEKTRNTWGDYRLLMSPQMTLKRAFSGIERGKFVNPMFKTSASNELCEKYGYVNFPVDLGIVGYRVSFTSQEVNKRTKNVRTLEELIKFTIGQGAGWEDIKILRQAGFTVIEAPRYKLLFSMTARHRFDLFSRGINEIKAEYEANKDIPGLMIEEHLALYYPLPRFYFTNKKNKDAIKRVRQGLEKAYADGSLLKLWKKYYRESIDFSNIKERRLFRIENPIIDRIDKSYEKFIYEMKQ